MKDREFINRYFTNKSILLDSVTDGDTFLITGADGFIGRNIVYFIDDVFKIKGFQSSKIIAVVHNMEKGRHILGDLDNVEFIEQDVTKEFCFFKNADYIIHTSGVNDTKKCLDEPETVMAVNVWGTRNLLEYAKRSGAKSVVLISSSSVYGNTEYEGELLESERGTIAFDDIRNVYAVSKLNMEFYGGIYLKQFNLPIKIVRLFHVFGLDMPSNNLITEFINRALNNENIVIKSNGEQLRNITYIGDALEALFYVMCMGKVGQAYNIGNKNSTISIYDLVKKIQKTAVDKTFDVIVKSTQLAVPSNYLNMVPSIFKIEQLGWSPRISLDEGLSLIFSSRNN